MDYVWINLVYALVAVVALFAVLRLLDLISGQRFSRDQLPIIKADPVALAVYRGCWVVGSAHLIGSMLGV